MFNGHLVFDSEVPSMLLDQCHIREGNEFTKMRYTAVTGDPNDFVVSGSAFLRFLTRVVAAALASRGMDGWLME